MVRKRCWGQRNESKGLCLETPGDMPVRLFSSRRFGLQAYSWQFSAHGKCGTLCIDEGARVQEAQGRLQQGATEAQARSGREQVLVRTPVGGGCSPISVTRKGWRRSLCTNPHLQFPLLLSSVIYHLLRSSEVLVVTVGLEWGWGAASHVRPGLMWSWSEAKERGGTAPGLQDAPNSSLYSDTGP